MDVSAASGLSADLISRVGLDCAVSIRKRLKIVAVIKQTPMYADYHAAGSASNYWGNIRCTTPDASLDWSKRGWDHAIRNWRKGLQRLPVYMEKPHKETSGQTTSRLRTRQVLLIREDTDADGVEEYVETEDEAA